MRNLILIIIEVIICYLSLVLLFKKYKTDGIYIYSIIAIIMASIMNLKTISIMSVPIPLGFGVTTSILIGINMIIQRRGKEEIKECILLMIIMSLISCTILYLASQMANSNYNLLANMSFNGIFNQSIRIYIALVISLIITIILDSNLYYIIKKLQNKIILSNIFSIIIAEFFENIIFVVIAYLFEYEAIDLFLCIILRYMIKTAIGIIGTLPLYITSKYD